MHEESHSSVPCFFILGHPRAGTTLLRVLLDAHPDVTIPPEFPVIPLLAYRYTETEQWDETTIRSFVDQTYRDPTLGHRSIKHLLKMFPEARFVCLVRDYRDMFCSLRDMNGVQIETSNVALQASRWKYVARQFLSYQKKYPDRFFLVRYEDLVSQPEYIFRKISGFLDIPYDQSVFDFYLEKEKIIETHSFENVQRFHRHLLYPVNTSRMNIWQGKMSSEEVALADQIAGRYADQFGYERKTNGFSLRMYLKSRPMAIYCLLLLKFLEYGMLLPSGFRRLLAARLRYLVSFCSSLSYSGKTKEETPTCSESKTAPAHSPQPW